MKFDPRPLLTLQETDLLIVQAQETQTEVAALLRKNEQLVIAAKQAIAEAEQVSRQAQTTLQQAETHLKELEEGRKKFLVQSASIKKNDEYQAAMAKIASLERQIAETEELVLKMMQQLEETKKAEQRTKETVAAQQSKTARERTELVKQMQELEKQLSQFQQLRATQAAAVEPGLLKRYETLRASHKFSRRLPVVVSVDDGVCARCRQQIPSKHREDARHGEFVTCEGCAAMLYSEAALQ